MHSFEEARSWIGARVDDVYGARVGVLADVYLDSEDGVVQWLLVSQGLDDGPRRLVPVHYSIAAEGQVWVPIPKDLIARAPDALNGLPGITRDAEVELCVHYGGLRRRIAALRGRASDELTCMCGSEVPRLSG